MARRAFYSFHYAPDNWRAGQVRNMGVIDGDKPASDNDWETVTKGGDAAIQRWIDNQLDGKSVAIVLIGANTAGRKWINYEIKKAWSDKKGLLGIHVHNIKDVNSAQATKGGNPFLWVPVSGGGNLSSIVKTYDPPYTTSTDVYNYIKTNLSGWIETAVSNRNNYV